MRILSLTIAALLALAGAVQAQIAAPRLNPTIPVSISAFNPAVLPWGGPSRVGAGLFDIEVADNDTGIVVGDGDGFTAHVRLVGENFAFQAETLSVSIDGAPAAGGGFFDSDETLIAGAYQGGEVFSIGVALESSEDSDPTGTEEASVTLLGATLRLGEIYFIGAAAGTATASDSGSTGETDTSVIQLGGGVHSRDADGGYHLEVFIENVDSAVGTTGPDIDKEESVGLTAEFVFGGGWLIGLEVLKTDVTDPTDPTGLSDSKDEEMIISLGWAPSEGLAVVLSLLENEEKPVGGGGITVESTLISVAWLF